MRGTSFLHYYMLVHTLPIRWGVLMNLWEICIVVCLDRAPLYLQSSFNHNRNYFAVFSGAHDIHFFMTNHKVCMC